MVDEALRTETLAAVKSIRQLGDRAASLAKDRMEPVSYTHLTLPTILRV